MRMLVHLFLVLISISPIHANDYNTNDVKKFIQYMKNEHNYDIKVLSKLFSEIDFGHFKNVHFSIFVHPISVYTVFHLLYFQHYMPF